MTEYIYPDVLVSTAWVAEHRHDPNIRIVESDEDILLYDVGHIPGAIKVDWQSELQHQVVRDYIDKDTFGRLTGLPAGRGATRWAHPRGGQYALGPGCGPGRHVQER